MWLTPNPVRTSATLCVTGVTGGTEVTCRIYSLQGTLEAVRQTEADGSGRATFPLRRTDFRSGIHVAEVQADGLSQTVKMIVE